MTNPGSINGLPAKPLKVKTSKVQFALLVFLGFFFLPIGLGSFYKAAFSGFPMVPTVVSLLCFGCFAMVAWLVMRGQKHLPKVIDSDGITRRDGQRFNWSHLKNVEHQYHYGKVNPTQKLIWRIEIRFENGTVWLIPLKIVNFREVYDLVSALPCEHLEKNYGYSAL